MPTRSARNKLSSCCTSFRPPSERPWVMYSWHTPARATQLQARPPIDVLI